MKSDPVKVAGKLFRYDFDNSIVEYIQKATDSQIDEEIAWEQKHGSQLYGIGVDGYIILSTAGLNMSNWKDADARKGYLIGWAAELEEEEERMAEEFVRYELPSMMEDLK